MNSMKRIFAALLVGSAGFGLFVACGGGESDCTFDADCPDGQACEANVCVGTCETDEDCGEGEVCAPGTNTDLDVCQVDEENNDNNPPNNTPTNNNTTTNNDTNNVVPPTLYYAAQIITASSGEDVCGPPDPGPDIYGVSLETDEGSVLGWGEVINENVQLDDNDHFTTGHLDGQPIESTACPDFNDDTVVALGCEIDNYIALRFLDGEGVPIGLDATAGQVIHVFEWGTQCSDTGTSDEYDVNVCTDLEAVQQGDVSSCNINLILGAEGEEFANVTGFE